MDIYSVTDASIFPSYTATVDFFTLDLLPIYAVIAGSSASNTQYVCNLLSFNNWRVQCNNPISPTFSISRKMPRNVVNHRHQNTNFWNTLWLTAWNDNINRLITQVINRNSFWATIAKTVRPCYQTVVLSCLSVTLVHCGQTVGWIKMKIGMQVSLGPGTVLDGDPPSLPQRDTTPNFWPISVVAKWLDGLRFKMSLDMEVGLGPGDFVLDGEPAPPPKKGQSPQFSSHVYCGQTAGWIKMVLGMEAGFSQGYIDPAPRPQKGGRSPNLRPISIVAKRLDVSRCHLVRM